MNRWHESNDPRELLDLLGNAADERRCEIAVRYMRAKWDAERGTNSGSWYSDFINWKDTLYHAWDEPETCPVIRCLWPSQLMERERVECAECGGGGRYKRYLGHGDYDEPDCEKCNGKGFTPAPLIDPRWLTPDVLALARSIRGDEPRRLLKSTSFSIEGNSLSLLIDQPQTEKPPTLGERIDVEIEEQAVGARSKRKYYGLLVTDVGQTLRGYGVIETPIKAEIDEHSGSLVSQPNPDASPILADALMDCGCDNEEILSHLQADCKHLPECWVIHELLGS